MNLAQATWAPGKQFSRYEILSRLARGGMAEVWRASAAGVEGFRREVVIKTMRPELAVSPDLVRMFINEATIAARLNHPGIIHVFDFGQFDERYFIAMEYVPGLTLRQLGRALRDRRLRMPRRLVLRVATSVARTLAYAHAACEAGVPLGFVHRDVTPENIMVSSTGATKLIDFGAAITHACPPPEGMFVGKFRYLSPERLRGENGDARADIYSLGVVLYECLTGRRPYDGKDVQELIVAGSAPDPSGLVPALSKRLSAVVLRAMAVDPEARYQRAADLADDLADLIDGRLGRDPLGATDHQASIILRQSENEGDELPDPATAAVGARGRRPSRTLRFGVVPPAVALTSPEQPMPQQTGHLRGTSVAVVLNDASDADEGNLIEPGFGPDVMAAQGGGGEPQDAADDDDDAIETSLFMRQDPALDSDGISPPRVPVPVDDQSPAPLGKRRPSRQRSRAAELPAAQDSEGDGEDEDEADEDDGAAHLAPPSVRAEAATPDPLAVVQRSLPELHGAPAWFAPGTAGGRGRAKPTRAEALATAAADSPGDSAASIRSVSAAACFERGIQLIAAKDLEAALVQWRQASALDPDRTWYRTNLERLVRHIESTG